MFFIFLYYFYLSYFIIRLRKDIDYIIKSSRFFNIISKDIEYSTISLAK